jgi:predicted outer membrane repeat protein
MFRLTPIVLLAAMFATAAAADTIAVSPDGPLTIQAAIDAALPGDVVELADGVYTGEGNRDLDFGGKAITLRSASGDPAACILDCEGSDTDHHRGIHFNSEEGPDSVVEGITIRNGYHAWSGGIYSETYCTPTIRHCRFLANQGSEGGGLCVKDAATVEDCWFEGNHSSHHGGGASAAMTWGWTPTFTRCTFVQNTAGTYGGAFRC